MPLRLRELLQQITQLIAERRRSYGTRQETQAGTLIPQMSRTQLINLHQKIAPAPHPPLVDQHLRTIWVIEIQHGSLHEDVSASEAPGMVIIASHLCRPPHEAPYQNALRNPLPWHGAGIEERFSGNELLRCVHVRNNFFHRHLCAGGQTRQSRRSPHQLQRIAPIHSASGFLHTVWKLVVQEPPVFFGFRYFFQAAPESLACVRFQLAPYGNQIEAPVSVVPTAYEFSHFPARIIYR